MNIIQSKKNQWRGVGVIVVLSVVASWYVTTQRPSPLAQSVVRIGNRQFLVELADTPVRRERGLGFRKALPSGQGMIFLFPESPPGRYAFWMKGMKFPLDIAWIRDGRVVFIERNISAESEDIFRPPTEAESVLEVNASELSGINPGDAVLVSDR